MVYISHSKIQSYPPNPIEFPNFYNCKEEVYILEEGDVLYIPPRWYHWVFSYPSKTCRENIAISYTTRGDKYIDGFYKFNSCKPFKLCLDEDDYSFLDISLKDVVKKCKLDYYQDCYKSENSTIVPVQKKGDVVQRETLSVENILNLHRKNKYNIVIGQDDTLANKLGVDVPHFIKVAFGDDINKYMWVNLLKSKDAYIETGLHCDTTHNLLIQVKGTKVVRLYNPESSKNLYLQPLYGKH